ncbi:cytochrome c3 family protein [Thiorhodococcus fuscus]|uniref:Cytochrome c3 family protein n=1 Tax=Thiorhodococcus fuscus TaxID=527200 RepID=A0ABW4Y9E4_9GAMM
MLWASQLSADGSSSGFVGRAQCAVCHAEEAARWSESHHDLAMQEANETSVLGDFDDVSFEQFGVVSRFYCKDGRFMVRTDGPDGRLQDYPISYTFGVFPLQQYLIELSGGRLQALDIAWDSRPKGQGGQRWIHLHPDDPVLHDDVLHWTGPNLNWNYMCADCHSTNLRKGYDASRGTYHTTWSEIDVSCEACHGPGARHVQWAEAAAQGEPSRQPDMGLTVRLNERAGVRWSIDPTSGKAARSQPRTTSNEIQVCARCHSRRSQMTDEVVAGQPFLDAFRPALLTEGLYHPDGQIEDEVYVWGSFLQSRMYHAGVTCSDCHDPHAANLRTPGDSVCYQCHTAERYATERHHFHAQGSVGGSCVECHMPPTHYMVVDARHDHSFRIPRPDQSVAMGTPNACNRCHADKTPQWAADQVKIWYGTPAEGYQHYASAFYAARQRVPGAADLLQRIAADAEQPEIARATALQALSAYPDAAALERLQAGLDAEDPLERLGALGGLESFAPAQRILAASLLWDDLKAVRIAAARLLAPLPADRLPESVRERLAQGIAEYIAVQEFNAERPEAQLNLGALYADLGRSTEAELAYRKAIGLQPRFIPAYVNIAHLLSRLRREQEADGFLRSGLERNPESADLHHALGLSLVRQKKLDQALSPLARAVELAGDNARYSYVYAVALHSSGRQRQAIDVLEANRQRHPGDLESLSALVAFSREAGERENAIQYAQELQRLAPDDASVEQLIRELKRDGR